MTKISQIDLVRPIPLTLWGKFLIHGFPGILWIFRGGVVAEPSGQLSIRQGELVESVETPVAEKSSRLVDELPRQENPGRQTIRFMIMGIILMMIVFGFCKC